MSISYGVVKGRIYRNVQPLYDPRAKKPEKKPEKRSSGPRKCSVDGVEYPTVAAACRAVGVNRERVSYRLQSADTVEYGGHVFCSRKG